MCRKPVCFPHAFAERQYMKEKKKVSADDVLEVVFDYI